MRRLNFKLREMCRHNRDGSYATRAERWNVLNLVADQLNQLGFNGLTPRGLKPKHIQALLKLWKEENISDATTKNRMCHIRWWAYKVNKHTLVPEDNESMQIEKRTFVTNESKARNISEEDLNMIADHYVRLSLELQRAFGLRREEAIKFQPSFADRRDHIVLKGSWCKGGRSRTVPIRTAYQRELLNRAHQFVNDGSLIPKELKYIEQVKRYENICGQVGLHNMHGLRHTYAQERYEELTGWQCPAAGGLKRSKLSDNQRLIDKQARLLISAEMGHHREQVTAIYLGR